MERAQLRRYENNVRAFETLRTQPANKPNEVISFSPHPLYDEYLKIHKIIVGPTTAKRLEAISSVLSKETLPTYLSVAGWAATEAALSQSDEKASYRNALLENAEQYWLRALETQLDWNTNHHGSLTDIAAPYRYALDIAHLPLIQSIISGDVTKNTRSTVAREVLNIAEANIIQMHLARKSGDVLATSDHIGVGYECNALLAFHSLDTPGLLAMPSSARADSGHYHPHQTHDLLIVQQRWGNIIDMTPAEIKSKASQNDRRRYKALLVRGKIHLSIEGYHSPDHTLKAFSAYFNDTQTPIEKKITDHARQTVLDLYWLYKKGSPLKNIASNSSSGMYRDASILQKLHPEIAPNYSNSSK